MTDITGLITGGVVLAAGGMIAYALKEVPFKIYKYVRDKTVYSVTVYQNDELFDIIEQWMFDNYGQHYQDVEAALSPIYTDMPTTSERPPQKELRFKQEENFFTAVISGKRIFVSKSKEKLDKAQSLRDIYYRKYIIRGFRAKNEINNLLSGIVDKYNEKQKKGVVKVYTNNSWGEWICVNDVSVKPFSKVVLEDHQKTLITHDLDQFAASKSWYKERSIRHKRGYLFYGSPGNGKTTIAMAISEYLNKDVYVMNLNSFENDGYLIRAFSMLNSNVVLLIEDIDRAFVQRENKESKVSFSTLLNSFDGALCRDGMITVITTNHIDKLDEALIRDGRVDVRMEIKNPTPEIAKQYVESFYDIRLSMNFGDLNMSMSSIQELCIKNKDNSLAVINHLSNKKSA